MSGGGEPGPGPAPAPGRAPPAFGHPARHLGRCASTNDEAAAWARAGAPEGAVVFADEQSAGRGRLGRRWHSPPGENLYLSLVLRPPIAPHRAPPLTLCAAVALAEAAAAAGAVPDLKWPNDLLLDGRKAAGILTEMVTCGSAIEHVVIGIGVNLAGREFPDELAGRATSLALATGRAPDRDRFAATLLAALAAWYVRLLDEGAAPVVRAWKQRARMMGRVVEVAVGDRIVRGVASEVDDDGALVLTTEGGARVRVLSGELLPPLTD